MKLEEVEAAAGRNPALRRLLTKAENWMTGMEKVLGVTPDSVPGKPQRTAQPPLSDYTVEGANGFFVVEVTLNPSLKGPVLHRVKTSNTLPFASSVSVTTYPDAPDSRIVIPALGGSATKYFQLESRYYTSDFNRPVFIKDAVTATALAGTGGILYVTHIERQALLTSDYPLGILAYEYDRNLFYINRAGADQDDLAINNFFYAAGSMRVDLFTGGAVPVPVPIDMDYRDEGMKIHNNYFGHVWVYSKTALSFIPAPEDDGRDYVAHYRTGPSLATGWHLCDGSTLVYKSTDAAATAQITVPNLSAGTYIKSGSYSGPNPTAAVAPSLSGAATGAAGAHTHALTGDTGAGGADHTHDVTVHFGADATGSAGAHTHANSVSVEGVHTHTVGDTIGPDGTHSHSVTIEPDGNHAHGLGFTPTGTPSSTATTFEFDPEVGIPSLEVASNSHIHTVDGITSLSAGTHSHTAATDGGEAGGAHSHDLSFTTDPDEPSLPHNHTVTITASANHEHTIPAVSDIFTTAAGGASHIHPVGTLATVTSADHTHTISATIGTNGEPKSMSLSAYIRL